VKDRQESKNLKRFVNSIWKGKFHKSFNLYKLSSGMGKVRKKMLWRFLMIPLIFSLLSVNTTGVTAAQKGYFLK
jgi:hypothetical protein